jgi:hypothetical protein
MRRLCRREAPPPPLRYAVKINPQAAAIDLICTSTSPSR